MKLTNYPQKTKTKTKTIVHKKVETSSKVKKKESKKTTKKSNSNFHFFQFFGTPRMIQVYGIILMAFAILLLIAIISAYFHFNNDLSALKGNTGEIKNIIGKFGASLAYYLLFYTFGIISVGIPFLFFIYGCRLTFTYDILPLTKTSFSFFISMAWISTLLGCFFANGPNEFVAGAFGNTLSQILITHTKIWGTILILIALLIIILIVFYNLSMEIVKEKLKFILRSRKEKKEKKIIDVIKHKNLSNDNENTKMPGLYIEDMNSLTNEYQGNTIVFNNEKPDELKQPNESSNIEFEIVNAEESAPTPISFTNDKISDEAPIEDTNPLDVPSPIDLEPLEDYDPRGDLSFYKFPPIDLLAKYEIKDIDKLLVIDELTENKNKIENTLKNFGIPIKRISVTMGPTVTLYEIVPADGVRISKIKNLEDDIALSLSALGIRIIAPIPGKGTIGIEVPNKNPQIVSMKEIITSDRFQNNKFDLPIGLGKTINNEPFVVDLAKMPHLLIAGATGQGKSVGLNAIITSLLYKKHPSEIKFVLVDPKKVEFTLYSIIEKHFLAKLPNTDEPIITDTKKVVETLNSLCIEMDARYDLLKLAKTRNIKEYNSKFCSRKLPPVFGHRYLPYIVLIIDEFGDLIMTAGREVETPIARLAQLARAVGIHLIIATQRPSVNIITGTIKANFPARIAFRVTSTVDSRTILDGKGANQLIGKGDMLLSTGSDLIRLQCAFVDTPEVEKIAQFIEEQQAYPEAFLLPEYVLEDKTKVGDDEIINSDEIDPFFMDAATLIVQTQMGSTSLIQRKLKLGYNRAGRIMDQMEEFGIVGPSAGSKAREVKVKSNEELMSILRKMGLFS